MRLSLSSIDYSRLSNNQFHPRPVPALGQRHKRNSYLPFTRFPFGRFEKRAESILFGREQRLSSPCRLRSILGFKAEESRFSSSFLLAGTRWLFFACNQIFEARRAMATEQRNSFRSAPEPLVTMERLTYRMEWSIMEIPGPFNYPFHVRNHRQNCRILLSSFSLKMDFSGHCEEAREGQSPQPWTVEGRKIYSFTNRFSLSLLDLHYAQEGISQS